MLLSCFTPAEASTETRGREGVHYFNKQRKMSLHTAS